MELKRLSACFSMLELRLLIVPYGIETSAGYGIGRNGLLLIVPYGIETKKHLQIYPTKQNF